MPLLVTGTLDTSPPRAVRRPAKRLIWVDPTGVEWPLTGEGLESLTGRSGFGLTQYELVTQRMPSGGALVTGQRLTPRVLAVPLLVEAATPQGYLELHRAFSASLRHKRGGAVRAGRIRVELPDGTSRSIAAYYQGGFDPAEESLDDLVAARQAHPGLEFLCPEPTWEGEPVQRTWSSAAGSSLYPIYPLEVAPSSVLGNLTEDVAGDSDAYPVWEITGPGTPTITNVTTGEQWAFTAPIPDGTTVTVDCRPVEVAPDTGLTAVDDSDTDWWPSFDENPQLWHLEAGTNELDVAVAGSTGDTRVMLTYAPRYQAGW